MRRFLGLGLALLAAIGCAPEEPEDPAEHADEWNEAYEAPVQDPSCSGVVPLDGGGFAGRVALTFDDGPSLATTPDVLETLAQHGISATFLINGSRVTSAAHRDLLAQMEAAGHLVGNHTQNHLNATKLSSAKLRTEIEKTDAILAQAGIGPGWFRFPFGASTCSTASIARSYGHRILGWHVDSADWCFAAGGGHCSKSVFKYVPDAYRHDMRAYVLSQVASRNGGIVLMHDVHAWTASELDAIVTALVEAGYTFVRVDDLETFPKLNGAAPKPPPWVGTPCQADADCSFASDAFCLGLDADEGQSGVCAMPCEGYCPDEPGRGITFCATLDDSPTPGACVQRATTENGQCVTIPGTTATLASRWVGSTSVKAVNAWVCMP